MSSVERVIAAPAEALFPLVADPRRHRDIDGSGTVRDATDLPTEMSIGSTFGMNMDFGGPYSMVSTVVEYEPNRRIAWQSRPAPGSSTWRFIFGGRIWRYEFEPVDGGTRVRESWDLTQERLRLFVWGYKSKTRKNMSATLERMADVATTS